MNLLSSLGSGIFRGFFSQLGNNAANRRVATATSSQQTNQDRLNNKQNIFANLFKGNAFNIPQKKPQFISQSPVPVSQQQQPTTDPEDSGSNDNTGAQNDLSGVEPKPKTNMQSRIDAIIARLLPSSRS